MEEINWEKYKPEDILELTLDRENGEIILQYIFQGVDKSGEPKLSYYDVSTGKTGNSLDLSLTSITGVKLLKKQEIVC